MRSSRIEEDTVSICIGAKVGPSKYGIEDSKRGLLLRSIDSMNGMDGSENVELSVCDLNSAEAEEWHESLRSAFECRRLTITHITGKHWTVTSIGLVNHLAVKRSRGRRIWLAGFEIIFPKNFVELCYQNINFGKSWGVASYHVGRGLPYRIHNDNPCCHWLTGGDGLIGMFREDFFSAGGKYPSGRTKNIGGNDDVNFKHRLAKVTNLGKGKQKLKGMFHPDHPGTHSRSSYWRRNTLKQVWSQYAHDSDKMNRSIKTTVYEPDN